MLGTGKDWRILRRLEGPLQSPSPAFEPQRCGPGFRVCSILYPQQGKLWPCLMIPGPLHTSHTFQPPAPAQPVPCGWDTFPDLHPFTARESLPGELMGMDGTTWQGNQTPVPALLQLSRPANPRACGLGLCAACVVPRGLPRSERQTALHTDTEGRDEQASEQGGQM